MTHHKSNHAVEGDPDRGDGQDGPGPGSDTRDDGLGHRGGDQVVGLGPGVVGASVAAPVGRSMGTACP